MQKKMNNKGFSLVELIIVIAIMAILVGVLAPQFMKYIESSRQSTDIQSASAIRSAIEAGVAEGELTSNVTVSITGTNAISVSGGGTKLGSVLSAVGLSTSTATKSGGWNNGALATYNTTSYKWQPGTASANSKEPKKDMKDAFK